MIAPAIRWKGSKFRIAPWIVSHFVDHWCYVDLFGGSGAVLLEKPTVQHEIYNDLNQDVVNFFEVLRTRPKALINAISLTPYSRVEHTLAKNSCVDPLEKARRFYVLCWQSFTYGGDKSTWRYSIGRNTARANPARTWDRSAHLWEVAKRFKRVQIECRSALDLIPVVDHKDVLFYVDPPYPHPTRADKRGYLFEMKNEDHIQLLESLLQVKGKVVVSSYNNDLYDTMLGGWNKVYKDTRTLQGNTTKQEVLYIK